MLFGADARQAAARDPSAGKGGKDKGKGGGGGTWAAVGRSWHARFCAAVLVRPAGGGAWFRFCTTNANMHDGGGAFLCTPLCDLHTICEYF